MSRLRLTRLSNSLNGFLETGDHRRRTSRRARRTRRGKTMRRIQEPADTSTGDSSVIYRLRLFLLYEKFDWRCYKLNACWGKVQHASRRWPDLLRARQQQMLRLQQALVDRPLLNPGRR